MNVIKLHRRGIAGRSSVKANPCTECQNPISLKTIVRDELDKGKYIITCSKCRKEWSYKEIREKVQLNEDEKLDIEDRLSYNRLRGPQFLECPECETMAFRENTNLLRVCCPVCTVNRGSTFEFCWRCLREWTNSSNPSIKCGHPKCMDPNVELLQNVDEITLVNVKGCPKVPRVRACIECGKCVEHESTKCKNVKCSCGIEFCFMCLLRTTECQKIRPGSWYDICQLAPRQTKINYKSM